MVDLDLFQVHIGFAGKLPHMVNNFGRPVNVGINFGQDIE